jgi:3-hydroxybutyryl-CoA dehydratase
MPISAGDRAEQTFHVGEGTIEAFAAASGDRNPVHFDEAYAAATPFGGRIAHGMLTAAFVSAVLGNVLPGAGTIYLGQTLAFRAPVRIGDDVRVEVEVLEADAERRRARLATAAYVGDVLVLEGEARVMPPAAAFAPA